ncbi:MAG TPA: glutathione S-transferase family protein [Solirubrobacteraceae bacterium]|nr:glutathione S-transferase family protein [Solirubrobacteraceae bacterium]
MAAADELPVLWHLKVSHYNEKARWALDYKGVPHVRRPVFAGTQSRAAKKLTGGETVPILVLDGQPIDDSTRIIARLEERYPDPTLYPSDSEPLRQALELEDFFDEELGPHIRLLSIHLTLPDPDVWMGAFMPDLKGARRLAMRAAFPAVRRQVIKGFGIDDRSVARAWEQLHRVGKRFQDTVRPSGYLVADQFTVADLTLAALSSPAATPPEFPYPQPQRTSPLAEPLRDGFGEYGLLDWTREMYARHRPSSAEVPAP